MFTPEQALVFLHAAKEHRLGELFKVGAALSLGLRKGEVTGLRPEDIDLDARIVHARRSLQWLRLSDAKEGHWIDHPPKRGFFRDLPMTDAVHRALLCHMARRQGEAATAKNWIDSGYLFVSITGAPLPEKNESNEFYTLYDSLDEPRIRFHDCRHSCGSFLNAGRERLHHPEDLRPFAVEHHQSLHPYSDSSQQGRVGRVGTLVETTHKKPKDQPDAKPAQKPHGACKGDGSVVSVKNHKT